MENTETQIKYPPVKTFEEKIKIYFMCARSLPFNPVQSEKFIGIVAYRPEDAMKRATEVYAPNPSSGIAIFSHGDFAFLEDIFREVHTNEFKPPEPLPAETKIVIPQEKVSFDQFINRLAMVATEYCDLKDKPALLAILERVKTQKVDPNEKILN